MHYATNLTEFNNTLINDTLGLVQTDLPVEQVGENRLKYVHIGSGYYLSHSKYWYNKTSPGEILPCKVNEKHEVLYYGVLFPDAEEIGKKCLVTARNSAYVMMSNNRSLLESYMRETILIDCDELPESIKDKYDTVSSKVMSVPSNFLEEEGVHFYKGFFTSKDESNDTLYFAMCKRSTELKLLSGS